MVAVQAQVEELADNQVRLTVDVPRADVKHAVDHAASDLADSIRIPGFRPGHVPREVLISRLGRERIYGEAVSSHISNWFWRAADASKVRPVAAPAYDYDLPASDSEDWRFTATVSVQPKAEPPDWTKLEVPALDPEVPPEAIDAEIEALRSSVADLAPVEDRPSEEGDTLIVDVVEPSGTNQRDLVFELGAGALLEEIERDLIGVRPGETRSIEVELADETRQTVEITVKEIKQKVLPPIDDDLARASTEFDTLEELRADIEKRIHDQLEVETESAFRAATADALVDAADVTPSPALVEARAADLSRSLVRSLQQRGLTPQTYFQLSGQNPEEVEERLLLEAERSVSRELVLEAVADKLGIEVTDDELKDFLRRDSAPDEDTETLIEQVWQTGRQETLREDLRLRRALDRVAADVTRIPIDLAEARDKLWTPEKDKPKTATKLWTPGSKEPA
jgi:trigger factor